MDFQVSRGLGSGRRSQASPVSLACSSAVSLLERPQTMRLGIQALRGYHDRLKDIGGGDDQQRNRLAFFFRDRDGGGKQFLLVVIEDLRGFDDRAAAEGMLAMVEARGHDHHVLPEWCRCVRRTSRR